MANHAILLAQRMLTDERRALSERRERSYTAALTLSKLETIASRVTDTQAFRNLWASCLLYDLVRERMQSRQDLTSFLRQPRHRIAEPTSHEYTSVHKDLGVLPDPAILVHARKYH